MDRYVRKIDYARSYTSLSRQNIPRGGPWAMKQRGATNERSLTWGKDGWAPFWPGARTKGIGWHVI